MAFVRLIIQRNCYWRLPKASGLTNRLRRTALRAAAHPERLDNTTTGEENESLGKAHRFTHRLAFLVFGNLGPSHESIYYSGRRARGAPETMPLSVGVNAMANRRSKKSAKVAKKAAAKRVAAKPALLAGGNPQIAKADGNVPVQAYIAAMPGWKRDVGRRLDALIVRNVPNVRKAVKWNSPFYGIEGQGWFLGFHVFTHYVKVTFFRGTSLRPVPPGGTGKDARWIDIHEDDLDKAQMATWVRQAAALPGWGKA